MIVAMWLAYFLMPPARPNIEEPLGAATSIWEGVLGSKKRKRRRRYQEIVAQVSAIERYLCDHLRPQFVEEYGPVAGAALANAVIDRLFARAIAPHGVELELAKQLSSTLAKENKPLRDAAFVSLRALLEVEGVSNNFAAERRIVDTIYWLKQFGEIPQESLLPQVLDRLISTGVVDGLSISDDKVCMEEPAPQVPIIVISRTSTN